MQEYVSDAIVLAKYPSGELDGRYALFTKRYGKMTGRTKSSRKVTSKLAPHLEPGNAIKARFIEMGGGSVSLAAGMQIVDALKTRRTGITLADLGRIAGLLPEMDPDEVLWEYIAVRPFSWKNILKILGWDPEGAGCAMCGSGQAANFYVPRQEFYCPACVSRLRFIREQVIEVASQSSN